MSILLRIQGPVSVGRDIIGVLLGIRLKAVTATAMIFNKRVSISSPVSLQVGSSGADADTGSDTALLSSIPGTFGARSDFLFCLGALMGYRFTFPHVSHRVTRISAHGFLPPLLRFSTVEWHVLPSIWTASQYLQTVCLTAGLCRI
jgi:hypothetical protein